MVEFITFIHSIDDDSNNNHKTTLLLLNSTIVIKLRRKLQHFDTHEYNDN